MCALVCVRVHAESAGRPLLHHSACVSLRQGVSLSPKLVFVFFCLGHEPLSLVGPPSPSPLCCTIM